MVVSVMRVLKPLRRLALVDLRSLMALMALWGTCAIAGETLENDALRIRFADAEHGFNVDAIENRIVDDTRFVNLAQGQAGFWRLDFVRKGAVGTNEHVFVDNLATAAGHNVERTARGLRFSWRGVDIEDEKGVLDVFAEVDLPPGATASEWRLVVSNRSEKAALYGTSYPCLGKVTEIGEGDVLIPNGNLGASLRKNYKFWDDSRKDRVSLMPGWHPPVTAFNLGEAGLYIAAHDPDQRYKRLVIQADHGVRFDTVVENAGIVGSGRSRSEGTHGARSFRARPEGRIRAEGHGLPHLAHGGRQGHAPRRQHDARGRVGHGDAGGWHLAADRRTASARTRVHWRTW